MSDLVELYPRSFIVIRKNSTGEVRVRHFALPWYKHSLFFWTDGNFGCDCNRASEFERAFNPDFNAPDPDDVEETRCGNKEYTVIKAIFPDGTEQLIDGYPENGQEKN